MAYEAYKMLTVEKKGAIGVITLNRPEQLNAVSPELHVELENIWVDIARDESVAAVVLTGAGRAFSAGGDLKRMAERHGTVQGMNHALRIPSGTRRLFQNILEVNQPVVVAMNGDAIGLGATIALFADISVIAEGARFGDTHVKVGLTAGDGGAVIWPLLVGPQRAKDFLMRGLLVKGDEAVRMNLVNYCEPADKVLSKAISIAEELATLPRFAVQWTKLSVNKNLKHQLNLVIDACAAYESLSMLTHDHLESVNAFLERRKPALKGY